MKVVGIVCSPRKGGNTDIMVQEALASASAQGAQTELIHVADKKLSFCDGCGACQKTGECRINDDMREIQQKMLEADGIILGTPVYFLNVSAQAKTVIDRSYALMPGAKLKGKVVGSVVIARRVGAGAVMASLYSYFVAQRMLVAGTAIGYGIRRGEVREAPGGRSTSALEEARALGRNIVSLSAKFKRS